MNTQANAVPDSSLQSRVDAPPVVPPLQTLYWSLRREFWENRSLYLAPLAVAAVFLLGFAVSITHTIRRIAQATSLAPEKQLQAITTPYDLAAGLLMFTGILVGVFYCVEALQGERRDRSILFWKSLPVSDFTAVLAKAIIPIFLLPLFLFAATFVLHWSMFLLTSAALSASGQSVSAFWTQLALPQMSLLVFYHLVAVHGIWHAPFYAWFLLVSAWARRMAFLWAVLPVLAIVALERLLFNTSNIAGMLGDRLSGGAAEVMTMPGTMPLHPATTHITLLHFLFSPGLWLGLVVTAAFVAAAARLRRYRDAN